MADTRPVSIVHLITVPALVTLGITILRLVGEVEHWPAPWFNTAPGGGAAVVGISWLPIIFGPYFAVKLAGTGDHPVSNGKAIGLALAGLAVMILGGFVVFAGITRGGGALTILGFLVTLAAAFVPRVAWPALGTTLLAYAFAARIPVLIVMFIAMRAGWTTHYSVIDPRLAHAPFWQQFIDEALLPQMCAWIGYTVVVGAVVGTVVAAIARRGKQVVRAAA